MVISFGICQDICWVVGGWVGRGGGGGVVEKPVEHVCAWREAFCESHSVVRPMAAKSDADAGSCREDCVLYLSQMLSKMLPHVQMLHMLLQTSLLFIHAVT